MSATGMIAEVVRLGIKRQTRQLRLLGEIKFLSV